MDEPMDMRDELEQDFGDIEETDEGELKSSGMHVDRDDEETPLEDEKE